jgi:FtsP/CotA-like multicopper oxidase with cupredoxin domain
LGTLNPDGTGNPLLWNDLITENPAVGSTEEWEIHNFTEDAHPIHVHLVQFKVLGRGVDGAQPPEAWETGYKDTVIAYPGEITRIKARFDMPGFYVWHCHIVEHEDNEMMRPYHVGPIPPDAPAQGFSIQPYKKK